jgi:3-hydroxyisobutyrate dehydrogenase-like beta-hydroxyacid dehydrogenase
MKPAGAAGVIGLGAMGHQFARHMIAKGYEVTGFDVSPACNEKAAAIGVKIVTSVAEVGRATDVVVIMVATDAQVESVIVEEGLLAAMKPGSVICVASSTDPNTARKLEKTCTATGVGLLDTPVVLGQEAANNGTCTCFVGGDERALEKARPVLACFSANVMHIGASGGGQIAKMINNLLLWSCISANFEALTFAKKLGADVPKLIEALKFSSGANWSLSRWGKSTGKWAEKDMDVALELAQEVKLPMPLAAHVDQLMKSIDQEKMKALLK